MKRAPQPSPSNLPTLTGLPVGSITPDHASIPEIPAITGGRSSQCQLRASNPHRQLRRSRELVAKGDSEHLWLLPEVGFGAQYNRNTTLLNNIGNYFIRNDASANNFSTGFSIRVPFFDSGLHAKARESAAEALRAKVEAEQAQQQNDIQIARARVPACANWMPRPRSRA